MAFRETEGYLQLLVHKHSRSLLHLNLKVTELTSQRQAALLCAFATWHRDFHVARRGLR